MIIEFCWCGSHAYADEDGDLRCSGSVFHDPDVTGSGKEPESLYLAGPMSGMENNNYPAFNAEAKRLREWGFTVFNPAEIGDLGSQYKDLLKKDIIALLECEGVAVLDGWWSSKGARLETTIAGNLDMPIRPVDEWITRASAVRSRWDSAN